MLSCRRATELIEKKKHCELYKIERLQLEMHLFMCKYCSNYGKHTKLMDTILNKASQSVSLVNDTSLLEEKIITAIKKE